MGGGHVALSHTYRVRPDARLFPLARDLFEKTHSL